MSASLPLTGHRACAEVPESNDGGYICNLHFFTSAGFRHDQFAMGNTDPLAGSLADLLSELRDQTAARYRMFNRVQLPFERFVGLSVTRFCMRPEHDDDEVSVPLPTPRAERVASIAIAHSGVEPFEVEVPRLKSQSKVSANGVGTVIKRAANPQSSPIALPKTLFLPATVQEEKIVVTHAVPAACTKGMAVALAPHIALRPLADGTRFIEQIVTLDELQ